MSDANQYINAYLEHAMGMLHDNLNNEIRIKTELKIANDLLVSKDNRIKELEEKLSNLSDDKEELNKAIAYAQQCEAEANGLKSKVGIVDALQKQFNDLTVELTLKKDEADRFKRDVDSLNDEVNSLKQELDQKNKLVNSFEKQTDTLNKKLESLSKKDDKKPTNSTKKSINKEDTKSSSISVKPAVMKVEEPKEIDDDF